MTQASPSIGASQTSSSLLSGADYGPNLYTRQFDSEVLSHIIRIEESERRRVSTEDHLSQLEQYMLRVFDRSTALLCINVQTWEKDENSVIEVGIAVYDPRLQELALSPNIKSYHFIIRENRNRRNGDFKRDHTGNFAGGTSHLFTKAQTCRLVDGLMRHYFGPYFPLSCLLVGHKLNESIKALECVGVFIHPNVPTLDTQVLFSYTHGGQSSRLRDALFTLNQPYLFLSNAGNCAYFTTLLALKLCDPMVRWLRGIDFLKENEIRGKKVRYKTAEVNKSRHITVRAECVLEDMVRVGVVEWDRISRRI